MIELKTSVLAKCCLVFGLSTVMTACKLQVIAPEGGVITAPDGTERGFVCGESVICSVEIDEADYSQTFTVTSVPPYEFVRWQDGRGFLCADSAEPTCTVTLPGGEIGAAVINLLSPAASIMPVYRYVGFDSDLDGIPDLDDPDDDNDGVLDELDLCPLSGPNNDGNGCPAAGPKVRFIVFGRGGTAGALEASVAAAAVSTCDSAGGCDFAIYLGDDQIERGVIGESDFINQYADPWADLDLPIYVALGSPNLDPDSAFDFWSGQDVADDGNWQFPSRFYKASVGSGSTTVDVFGLDTPSIRRSAMTPQGSWLDGVLAGSFAQWKFAFGYNNYISNGVIGNAGDYNGTGDLPVPPEATGAYFKSFVEEHICGNVDIYFSGQDQNLQRLQPVCDTGFIISGSAGGTNVLLGADSNVALFQAESAGFVMLEAQGVQLTMSFYDQNGTLLYSESYLK